ncbi:MAG: hypothetical protein ACLP07_02255 [Terracidiphilus sp.]
MIAMHIPLAVGLLAFGSAPLVAQVPAGSATPVPAAAPAAATAPAAEVHRDDIGFSYSLPSDWEFVVPPTAPKPVVPYPMLASATKGDACVELAMTAKHGSPASAVVVMALPFSCYGQTMTASDLENFGEGAAQGMKQTFDVTGPMQTTYSLGSHTVWIERATGTPKNHVERSFTFEIACTVLEKGAVCWMTMAADAASLQAFKQGTVSLDGEAPAELVPADAFVQKKPS